MANSDRARKLLVRTALVTSTTIATLVGAQNLAMLDASQFLATQAPVTENVVASSPNATNTPAAVIRAAPDLTILKAAPSVIILRQSGEAATTLPVIQPPVPAQIAAPDPVIVQRPATQRSRSSR